MIEENKFIEKVARLFEENGAKSLTMDDIAKEFGISKRTLYKDYKNKEELLEEVLTYRLGRVLDRMKNLENKIDNPIDRMLSRDKEIKNASSSNRSIMLRQLTKYYPQIFSRHMKDFSEKFSLILLGNIKKGREQGYYREDFDAQFYSKLFFQLAMSYNTPYLDTSNISHYEYQTEGLRFYLYAITTQKGREYLEALKEKNSD